MVFLESPYAVVAFGTVFSIVSALAWWLAGWSGVMRPLVCGCLGTVVLLGAEYFVETEREYVARSIRQMADDLQRNDLPAVLQHIHPSVPQIRKFAEQAMPEFAFTAVEITRLREIRLKNQDGDRQAVVDLIVTVEGKDREGAIDGSRVPHSIIMTLQRHAGRWYLLDLAQQNPQKNFRSVF